MLWANLQTSLAAMDKPQPWGRPVHEGEQGMVIYRVKGTEARYTKRAPGKTGKKGTEAWRRQTRI